MRFAQPEILNLLWLIPVLGTLLVAAGMRRRRRTQAFASAALFDRLVPDLSSRRRVMRELLRLLSIGCLIVALARPQFGQRVSVLSRQGIDLVVAIDASASMLAQDTGPDANRLVAATRIASGLFDRLRGDRVGIVVFAGRAFVQCPLTIDDKAARMMLAAIGPETVPEPGTAIAAAITQASDVLGKDGPWKAIVLFTDGEDHAGDPVTAARRAAAQGVRIFTVGIGAKEGELIPVFNQTGQRVGYKRDKSGELVVSRLDERTLVKVAEVTGGRYFRSRAGAELDALFAEIDAMEKREVRGGFRSHYEDRFHIFAVAAFILLAVSRWIGERRPRARRITTRGLPGTAAVVWIGLAAVSALVAGPGRVNASPGAADVRAGNAAQRAGELEAAVEHYLEALDKEPARAEIFYNLGSALYHGADYEQALGAFGHAASRADSSLVPDLSYNLGNALFRQEQFAAAAEAYKETLRQRPDDRDAKWNLELAQRRMQEQRQGQQNEDQQTQNEQDQEQDREEPQPQDQPDQQEPDRQEQDQQEQDQDQREQDQQEDQSEQESQTSPAEQPSPADVEAQQPSAAASGADEASAGMTAEDARRWLEALGNDEQELLRNRFRARRQQTQVEKDW